MQYQSYSKIKVNKNQHIRTKYMHMSQVLNPINPLRLSWTNNSPIIWPTISIFEIRRDSGKIVFDRRVY